MNTIVSVLLCGVIATSAVGQDQAVKIMLTNTPPATYLIENLPRFGCSNVSIVTDARGAL